MPWKTLSPLALAVLSTATFCLVLCAPLAAQQEEDDEPKPPPVRPELTFEEEGVSVSGLSPEGEAVLFGVARLRLGYHQRVERFERVLVADASGAARFEPSEGLPPTAVWTVVDLPTGETAFGPTPGFERTPRQLPTAALHGRGGVPGRLHHALESAQILYVRPGEGAWGMALLEGTRFDRDEVDDGVFDVAFEDFVAAATAEPAEPPAEPAAGDVVLMVDPTDLTPYSLRVTPDALR